MPRRFIIDTDTASDDAVALLLAAAEPSAQITAVTVVAGNVPLALAVKNAIVTLDLAGAEDVPVHGGLAGPIVRALETAQDVHGADGMSGADLPPPSREASSVHAVDVLRQAAAERPGEHTLVTLGPLSNIAAALLIEPDLLTRYEHTYMMVGSPDGVGNVSVTGEYNAWADPEAARIVIEAAGDKTMVGWNISRKYTVMDPEEQKKLRACGPLGAFASDINVEVDRFARVTSGLAGYDLPDPVTMAVALDPSIITHAEQRHVTVGIVGVARGATIVDARHEASAANCRVVWAADEAAFKERLYRACTPR